jgi:hypothetical protein
MIIIKKTNEIDSGIQHSQMLAIIDDNEEAEFMADLK